MDNEEAQAQAWRWAGFSSSLDLGYCPDFAAGSAWAAIDEAGIKEACLKAIVGT